MKLATCSCWSGSFRFELAVITFSPAVGCFAVTAICAANEVIASTTIGSETAMTLPVYGPPAVDRTP